jgi:diguanylate cyclase (GGDEF)-like protein/PAS domain S-box-containing protein
MSWTDARVNKLTVNNGLMALSLLVSGELASLLTLPPHGASPFWLPAGMTVAAVLLWRYSLLPGLIVGAVLLGISQHDSDAGTSWILAGLLSALWVSLLALIARILLCRKRRWPDALLREKQIIRFLIQAALIAPFFPACLLALGQWLPESQTLSQLLHLILQWWLSSAVGVVIVTPLMLSGFAQPRSDWQPRIFSVSLPVVCLLIAVLVVVTVAREHDDALNKARFESNVEVVQTLVENEINYHQSLLQSLQAYINHSEQVTASEFQQFVQDYSSHTHDISYLAWLHYQDQGTTPTLTIQYLSHFESNESVTAQQGMNLCPVLGKAVCQQLPKRKRLLLNSEQLSALLGGNEGDYSLFQRLDSPDGQLLGWLMQTVNYVTLFADLNKRLPQSLVDFTVTNLNEGRLIHNGIAEADQASGWQSPLQASRIISLAEQRWRIDYQPSGLFVRSYANWLFYWVAVLTLLSVSLMLTWLLAMSGRVSLVEEEVADKTRELNSRSELLAVSEERYRRLVENIQDEYFLYSHDREGIFHYISPSITPMLGYSQAEFMTHYSRFLPDNDRNREVASQTASTLAGSKSNYELDIFSKSGKLHTLAVTEMPSYNDAGEVIGVEGIARDITEFKVSQQKLEKLSLAVEHSPNAVLIMDKNGQVEYVNPKFTAITGFSNDEELGQWPDLINSGVNAPGIYDEIWRLMLAGQEWQGELQNRKKNGDLYWAQELIAPMTDELGEVTHFVATQVDITEARRLSEETSYQATHDQLTGLINRHEFDQRLNRVIVAASHNLTEHALCFMDLDQFKLINDTCGHIAGDELLRQVGSLLQGNVRSRDTIARLGGDEFGILMEHCSIDQAFKACQQILTLLQDFRFHWQDYTFTIGASIGLAIIDQHTRDANEALRYVDTACYSAKDAGRNRVEVHREDSLRLQQRRGEIQWSTEISEALDDDRFLLYAQPIMPLQSPDQGMSYEVLVRMLRKDGEISPPGAFLPAAERYNSITRIDRWVVSHTLDWLTRNAAELNRVASISINLSGLTLSDESMLRFIIETLEQGSVPAEKIKFEITETAAIANLRAATQFIETLLGYGIRFALDDFGSGLSSFAYLKKLQVDALKIDGMFVKDMLSDRLDFEMVKSINEIGHVMGLKTIAEFVENEDILERLREVGVDYVQGYAIGKPMPIDDILLDS